MSEAIIPSIAAPTVVVATATEHIVAATAVQDVIATVKSKKNTSGAAPRDDYCLDEDLLTGRKVSSQKAAKVFLVRFR